MRRVTGFEREELNLPLFRSKDHGIVRGRERSQKLSRTHSLYKSARGTQPVMAEIRIDIYSGSGLVEDSKAICHKTWFSTTRFSGEAINKNKHPPSVKVSPWVEPKSARQ